MISVQLVVKQNLVLSKIFKTKSSGVQTNDLCQETYCLRLVQVASFVKRVLCRPRIKYPYSHHRRDLIFRPKHLKKYMESKLEYQRGGECIEKIPFMGEVQIFYVTAHNLPAIRFW